MTEAVWNEVTSSRAAGRGAEGEEDDFEDSEEGDIAADYLEELLDIVGMDGDIEVLQ